MTRLATASVLAALAVAGSTGTAAATPTTQLPQFSWSGTESDSLIGGLDGLLLDAREVSRIAGTDSTLRDGKVEQTLSSTYSVTPFQCLSAYAPGQTGAYLDAAPGQVAFKSVFTPRDSDGDQLTVPHGVVEFGSKQAALAFMSKTATAWKECGGVTVTEAEGGSWEMGSTRVNEERTVVTLDQQSTKGPATCERAMAAYRNVFIDAMYCSPNQNTSGMAAAVVDAIAEKAAAS
ncbi:sensor domain-containing protein [Mycolicibacterium sp. HK-90]|uniref:sensor domain-containing protein n=1 Tax=Mycolicibacterium sp. HK-90 TaxID=3056937 RepID=UPI002658CF69|nr:sensor domain-containing protein [Mycolicibacterium sp. HK-90]WKG03618.1 sensor domain-containing protein [Mycolicibacterium sp. HK-90]